MHLSPFGVTNHDHSRSPLKNLGVGDSGLLYNLMPPSDATTAFKTLRDEVQWNKMRHRCVHHHSKAVQYSTARHGWELTHTASPPPLHSAGEV